MTSQGYIVYSSHKKLATKYQGLDSKQIAECIRNGENVHDEPEIIPEIAFTGKIFQKLFRNITKALSLLKQPS